MMATANDAPAVGESNRRLRQDCALDGAVCEPITDRPESEIRWSTPSRSDRGCRQAGHNGVKRHCRCIPESGPGRLSIHGTV